VSEWFWTTRSGFEQDLVEELGLGPGGGKLAARVAGPAQVRSAGAPAEWPVFARAGFPVGSTVALPGGAGPEADRARAEAVAAAVAAVLAPAPGGKPKTWHLQGWVPDADALNPLAPRAEGLAAGALGVLEARAPGLHLRHVARGEEARRLGGVLVQLVLVGPETALVGVVPAVDVPTLAPGGRVRAHLPGGAPSRAGRKLVEALEWLGRRPEPGDVCVDLGAAPGGWSAVLLDMRAKVIAVDPAELAPDVRRKKGLTHVKASAFDFVPTEPVDWLFCDMAWRPLEVAQMLAKWGRRHLAGALVSNIKLPMKQRAAHVAKVRQVVAAGGWRDVRARQLYHDREEITLTAWGRS
jgi:23S rRNA (cytidine2498-2'-O)-methyltransferase